MKNRLKKKIGTLMCLGLVTLTAFSVAFTAAAYAIYERHTQKVTVDLDYSKYFGTGSGVKDTITGRTKYFITDSQHLRNLSFLVNAGVFSENDDFELKGVLNQGTGEMVFTYTGDPLMPIGNDAFPFRSHFYGEPKDGLFAGPYVTIVENLVVLGTNNADVGMFGYVSNEGIVENFILDSPRVETSYTNFNQNAFSDGLYSIAAPDNNPMRNLYTTKGVRLFTNEECEKIQISDQTYTSNTNAFMKSFKIDLGGLVTSYKLDKKEDIPVEIEYEISNPTLIGLDNVTYPDLPNYFKVFDVPAESIPKDFYGNAKKGDYFTISVIAKAICPVKDGNITRYVYSKMCLERFKFYYDYLNKAIISEPTDFKCFTKTILPNTIIEEKKVEDTNGDLVVSYVKTDNTQTRYVGVVVGRLDGTATRIGVKTPVLNLNSAFVSNSLLIGKSIDDDNKRTLSKEDLSVSNIDNGLSTVPSFKYVRRAMEGDYSTGSFYNSDTRQGNRYIGDVYHKVEGDKSKQLFTIDAENTLRIFGTRSNHTGTAATGNPNDKVYPGDLKYNNWGIKGDDGNEIKSITFTQPMSVTIGGYKISQESLNFMDFGYSYAQLAHLMQFWVTAKHKRSKVNAFNNGTLDFYLDIDIDFAFRSSKYLAQDSDDTQYNSLQFLAAERSLRERKINVNAGKYKTKFFYGSPRSVSYKIAGSPFADANSSLAAPSTYTPEVLASKTDAPKNINEVLTKKTDNTPYKYPFAVLDNYYVEQPKIDEFGKPVIDEITKEPVMETVEKNGNELLKLTKKDCAGGIDKKLTKADIRSRHFTISANKDYKIVLDDKGKGMYKWERISIGFFPVFWLGIASLAENESIQLDIINIKTTLSNKKGNIDSSYGTVDFVLNRTLHTNAATATRPTWTSTGTKVYVSTISNEEVVDAPTSTPEGQTPAFDMSRITKTKPEAITSNNKHCQYLIRAERTTGNNVSVTYNIVGLTSIVDTLLCQNTDGYKLATITEDKTLK